jgi:hypothetical protein
MFYNGSKWENVVKSGGIRGRFKMAEKSETLTELACDINGALVKLGKADWRREFNARLWSCNRDKAIALINEYHDSLVRLALSSGWKKSEQELFSPLRS